MIVVVLGVGVVLEVSGVVFMFVDFVVFVVRSYFWVLFVVIYLMIMVLMEMIINNVVVILMFLIVINVVEILNYSF